MRLGCEATAIDINPVAWFILKCTLEYPQKLAGQVRPLPKFALESPEFMEQYFKSTGKLTKKQMERNLNAVQMEMFPAPDVDLSWHVRAWGWWVLRQARKELAPLYPTYADYEPLDKKSTVQYEPREPRLVPLNEDGTLNIDALNADFDQQYLHNPRNPRWLAKPTVAYLWARTVKCKNCRATVPLLKTRWLSKKANKRVLLTMDPREDGMGVLFGVESGVPIVGGNAAQRREHDKRIGGGTMSRAGVRCPCCGVIMTMGDVGAEALAGRLDSEMTTVIIEGQKGKEYRCPRDGELAKESEAHSVLKATFEDIPFGTPTEPVPKGGGGASRAFSVDGYGFAQWCDLFTNRQLVALGGFVRATRKIKAELPLTDYSQEWQEAIAAEVSIVIDKLADYSSSLCTWHITGEKMSHVFVRYALPITWDYAELNPLSSSSGNYEGCLDWVVRVAGHTSEATAKAPTPRVIRKSGTKCSEDNPLMDVVITDPPYYDAIPYADLMDYFYVWLRRVTRGLSEEVDGSLKEPLAPKWDSESNDGEIIDDSSRFEGDKERSRATYEDGMARVFCASHATLKPEGRLVIVFAHKHPDAWGALVTAIIRAGFIVDASWPIQTEMGNRTRALSSAALSSSVWLVCKKRPESARPGWDNRVLDEMREKITDQLREFWDAGIRGPDFVWAATGPALEAYSKHPAVKKASSHTNELMTVSEFLQHVRRMVVDFVVGRVLTHGEGAEAVEGMDDITTYYLLHRNDFGLAEAPVGACIMYAISCGLSDRALADQFDILTSGKKTSSSASDDDEDETSDEDDGGDSSGSGSTVKLQPWGKRTRKSLGLEAPGGRPVPLIDQVHRLMHLWKKGDVVKVDEYLDERGLRNNKLFHQLLQALIELADAGNGERSILESISNHVAGRGLKHEDKQMRLDAGDASTEETEETSQE